MKSGAQKKSRRVYGEPIDAVATANKAFEKYVLSGIVVRSSTYSCCIQPHNLDIILRKEPVWRFLLLQDGYELIYSSSRSTYSLEWSLPAEASPPAQVREGILYVLAIVNAAAYQLQYQPPPNFCLGLDACKWLVGRRQRVDLSGFQAIRIRSP